VTKQVSINYNGIKTDVRLTFEPYQSQILQVSERGTITPIDIQYRPKDPLVRPREKQRMNF